MVCRGRGPAGAVLPHTPLAPCCPRAVSLTTPPPFFCNGPSSLSRPPLCEAAAASAATRAPQQPPPSPLPVSSFPPRSCRPCGSPCCGPSLPAATERRPQRGRSSTPPCPSTGTWHRPQRGRTSTPTCPSTERRQERGGCPGSVLRSAAARRFNMTRQWCLRPKNINPRMLLGVRAGRSQALAIAKEFSALSLTL